MATVYARTGGCLCGAVRIHAPMAQTSVGSCHCGMCRKWSGGPWMAVDCGDQVSFEGGDSIKVYDSSPWAERGFCSHCGSHLFYRIKKTSQHMIPPGLFDDQSNFVFDHQVFMDRKPEYYDFANNTRNLTQAQVFARYGSE